MAPSLERATLSQLGPPPFDGGRPVPSEPGRRSPAGERQAAMGALRDAVAGLLGADRRRRGRGAGGDALPHTHLRAMFLLLRQGEATAGALGRAAHLNPASVTAMVDQLQRRGLVERRRHVEDRRVCLVALTVTGQEVVAAQEEHAVSRLDGLLEDFTDEELRAATRVLGRLAALAEDPAARPDGCRHGPPPADGGW
jgi:DNA-binding MarR family transcriptional regulator